MLVGANCIVQKITLGASLAPARRGKWLLALQSKTLGDQSADNAGCSEDQALHSYLNHGEL